MTHGIRNSGLARTRLSDGEVRGAAIRTGRQRTMEAESPGNPARLNPPPSTSNLCGHGGWLCNRSRHEASSGPSSRAPFPQPLIFYENIVARGWVWTGTKGIVVTVKPLEPLSCNLEREIPSGFTRMTVETMPRARLFRKLRSAGRLGMRDGVYSWL